MKFAIEIGEREKHRLEYEFNQLFGRLRIKVDRQLFKETVRLFNEPVLEVHALEVGCQEPWSVRIEKVRKPLFGHINRLYLNNRLTRVF